MTTKNIFRRSLLKASGAIAAGGTGDQAGNVDELDRSRDHLLRLDDVA